LSIFKFFFAIISILIFMEINGDNKINEKQIENQTKESAYNNDPNKHKKWFDYLKGCLRNYKIIAIGFTVVVIVMGIFYFGGGGQILPAREFGQTYSLVNEKVSKSATVIISLPKNVNKAEAKEGISFEPEIKGRWIDVESKSQLAFKPSGQLEVGKYYTVSLRVPSTQIKEDFLVDDNPRIDAIFPASASETHENSNITIVFNRPMVPLTTLEELDKKNVPIEIIPDTEGKFKWISTRNLQFIPKDRLQRSTNYTVKVKEGLTSMDGLTIEKISHQFTTRPLRYVDIRNGQTLYNQPITLVFNQPVDIDKTFSEIIVKNATGDKVPFIAEYGVRNVYNREKQKNEEFIDRSILNIYQKKDRHGRDSLWDFKTNYKLEIKVAYPLEGDIILEQSRTAGIQIPDIIESISAESERSRYVRPDLFDPEGKLIIRFFEEIDINKSNISAKGLSDIQYGEQCKQDDEGRALRYGTGECEKEDDKKNLIFTFKKDNFGKAENISVEFKKIYNTDGLKINADPIVKTITTYSELLINRTIPSSSSQGASLTEFIICSNTPIKPKDKEEYKEALITDGYLVFSRWQNPIYIEEQSLYYKCSVGEFESRIRYGLLPETDYSLTVKVEDDFDQNKEETLAFKTTVPDQKYFRFHNLQKVYNVTQPGKTKLTFGVENLEFVNLHICKVSPETLLENLTNRPERTNPPSASGCQSIKTDTIQLPRTYWVNNYFQINLQDYFSDILGHYIISFSHPNYRDVYGSQRQIYDRTYVSVTNLAIGEKRVEWEDSYYSNRSNNEGRDISGALTEPGQNLYWVSQFNSLEPVVGANVSLYSQYNRDSPIQYATFYTTDVQGIARGDVVKDIRGAVVRYLNDSAIVSDWTDTLQSSQRAQEAGKTYIYTDRPIYRPGHEVFIKGIDRIGYDGTYEIFQERNANLKITDSRSNVVYEQNIPISTYGTFNTSFVVPSDAPLGTYRITVFGTESRFDVEEYVPSAFKLDVISEKDEYIAGEVMKLDVNADYFFGVPVEGGEVDYSVTSQDYYFDKFTDEYFNFGKEWYFCYSCGYGDDFLFRGKTTLGQDGKVHIEKIIDFNQFYKDGDDEGSKIFIANFTVKDSNGRSVSAQKSFIVHRGEVYLGIKADKSFLPKNEKFLLRVKSVDTEGKPISKGNITFEINKITWNTFKRREVDGGFYYRSEKEKQLIKKSTIKTDSKGNWDKSFSLPEEGQYEITLFTEDSLDNSISASTNMYIYGDGQVSIQPTNNYTLEIETDRLDVNVGDKPKIIIKSPYKKAKALITVDRGKVFDYWVVDVNRNLFDHTIPIKKEYSPNVYVSALLLSEDPEIKFGQIMFNVDKSEYELSVDVVPDKTNYLPGETVNLTIKTTNNKGQPVRAEVSIAVADLSVLALKGNPKKNPLVFFYDGFPLTVTTRSNVKNILYELDIPLGTKGGGGGDPDDLARRKRGIFRDTAFWEAEVETNQNGVGAVSFTLPDNLTTWQVESVGVTGDTLVGVDYDEIISRKDLMVVPLKPRFIIPGDEFFIGAKIFNQTEKKQKINIGVESDTLELLDKTSTKITLDDGKSDTIYFKVKAPESMQAGTHSFIFSAKSSLYEDTIENTISITRNDTYEAVATANFTKDDGSKEYIYIPESALLDKGGLTINTNATMAVFLSDALNYMVSYPYGCSEQLASKLASIGVVRRGLNIENVGDKFTLDDIVFEGKAYSIDEVVKLGLGRIYENQLSDGGFAYYKGLNPNFYLTLHVVQAFENLRKAGFKVNQDSLNRASAYLYRNIISDVRFSTNIDLVILTTFTLMDVDSFSVPNKNFLKNKIENIVTDKKFINEDISSVSLAYLAIITSENYSSGIKDKVFKALQNRIDTDGRGAYLKGNKSNVIWEFYETPIKNTALLLKALVAHRNEHPLLDKVLRWLLRSRDKDNSWGSTNNTLTTIDSMVDFLQWQRETESDFTLSGDIDGKKIFDFDFNKDTILETFTRFIPIDDFTVNNTHTLSFNRTNRNNLRNNFYYDMSLKYYLPIDQIPSRDEGITISRSFYDITDEKEETPLNEANIGDVLKGKLIITIPKAYNFVSVEDFIPAGFELVNTGLATEDKSLEQNKSKGLGENINTQYAQVSRGVSNINIPYLDEAEKQHLSLRPDFEELHDDRLFLFKERISPGVYEYEYYVRALVPGTFHHLPAVASEMYFPEIFGRTEGNYFTVVNN
jgi:uncharacterized protein YfaS (alpha-2-macroglobulin family)